MTPVHAPVTLGRLALPDALGASSRPLALCQVATDRLRRMYPDTRDELDRLTANLDRELCSFALLSVMDRLREKREKRREKREIVAHVFDCLALFSIVPKIAIIS